MAFKQSDDAAVYLLKMIEEAIDSKIARELESLRYEILSASSGAPKSEEVVANKVADTRTKMLDLVRPLGNQAGLGGLLGDIHDVNIDIARGFKRVEMAEPMNASEISALVSLAQRRNKLLRQAVESLPQ